jgi:hypothetical protein
MKCKHTEKTDGNQEERYSGIAPQVGPSWWRSSDPKTAV